MWDLVGNPEDQFSHDEAQITQACYPDVEVTSYLVKESGNPEDRFSHDGANIVFQVPC